MKTWARRGWLCLFALMLAGMSGSAQSSGEVNLREGASVWVATERGLVGFAPGKGAQRALLPVAAQIDRLTVDGSRGRAWLVSGESVAGLGFDGQELARLSLPGPKSAKILAVLRSADGSLWLARGSTLVAMGAGGQHLQDLRLSRPAEALGLDEARDLLWVAGGGELTAHDAVTGQRTASFSLRTAMPVTSMGADPRSGALWVAWPDRVRSFRPDGRVALDLPLRGTRFLAPDGHGGIWIATSTQLLRLSPFDGSIAPATPFPAGDAIIGLAADSGDVTAWVASRRSVVHVGASGRILEEVAFATRPIRALAVVAGTPEAVPPQQLPAPALSQSPAVVVGQTAVTRTVTLYASADSYIRQGSPSQNVGGDSFLRIRSSGPNRALVRFDPAQIAAALAGGTLVSANLQMRIQSNGGNWGDGRTVAAHRLTADWTESGVTWSCPVDTVPTNSHADCPAPWNGGRGI